MLRSIFSFLAGLILLSGVATAQDWSGNWDSSFGQLRLVQDGGRVWGDYADRGVIEARVSADNSRVRGVFVYTDGRWGLLEFRHDGDRKFDGNWSWGVEIFDPSRRWAATRDTETPDGLRFANGAEGWPTQATGSEQAMIRQFAFFEAEGGILPEINWEPNPFADPEPSELGFWYGSYELTGLDGFASITLDIDHLDGGTTGLVNMQMQVLGLSECPEVMHVDLCAEILTYAGQGTVILEVEGVLFETSTGEEGFVAFRLPNSQDTHILRMGFGGGKDAYFAGLVHPRRGVDYQGYLTRSPHVCDVAACQGGRFGPLIASPEEWRGVFDRAGFLDPYNPDLDNRDVARRRPGAAPEAAPMRNGDSWLAETWAIHDETSYPVGVIEFARDASGKLTATGEMDTGAFTSAVAETFYMVRAETQATLEIAVTLFADGSSEQALGRMVVANPGTAAENPTGTLSLAGDIIDVTLVPVGDGDWRAGDVPAFGVYGTTFALHNIPAGSDLVLRSAPEVAAPATGQIDRLARGLLINNCQPDVDNIGFETGDVSVKLSILAATWCQIDAGAAGTGWVKGVFLYPEG